MVYCHEKKPPEDEEEDDRWDWGIEVQVEVFEIGNVSYRWHKSKNRYQLCWTS